MTPQAERWITFSSTLTSLTSVVCGAVIVFSFSRALDQYREHAAELQRQVEALRANLNNDRGWELIKYAGVCESLNDHATRIKRLEQPKQ